jgi:hypothetical protein
MKRSDGTFSIAARFDAQSEALGEVDAQVSKSIQTRVERDHAIFESDFSGRPRLVLEEGTILVIFEGKADAKLWKDWLVAVAQDVDHAVDSVKFREFYDVVAGRPTTP